MADTETTLSPLNIMVTEEIREALRVAAFEERRSMSEIVREALVRHKSVRKHMGVK